MPPTWVNTEWLDDDIFKLSKLDIDTRETRDAATSGYRWRGFGVQEKSSPFARAVGGLEPISQDKVNKATKAYVDVLRNPPSDASLQDAWRADLRPKSQLSTVVNGCFLIGSLLVHPGTLATSQVSGRSSSQARKLGIPLLTARLEGSQWSMTKTPISLL